MPFIYNQALAHRLGTALIGLLDGGQWTLFDAAVAWARRSGTRHLLPSFTQFLQRGGVVRLTVGVDIENTSKEGLQDLLSLCGHGDCQVYVHHNEASVIFHPKVYLFRNNSRALLIIGSNNMTEAGLFTNTEVSLQIDAAVADPVVADTLVAMESWRDTSERLARLLDAPFLQELVQEGYVLPESNLRRRRRRSERRRSDARGGRAPTRLFGARPATAPAPPGGTGRMRASQQVGGALRVGRQIVNVTNALIMRVRPARGTQVQIPIPLRRSAFFRGQSALVSGHDGARRGISATRPRRAGGKVNTYKVEIPETRGLAAPVMRLDRTPNGIFYYAYGAPSRQGRVIMDALEAGRHTTPPLTVLTKPSNPQHSTWYRFI